jgi:carbonic anhydrase
MRKTARMFDDLLSANQRYASSFRLGGLAARAEKGLALVTCIDSRIEPLAALGLRPGDAKILRNAGGRVTPDVLRSLAVAVAMLNVRRVAIMHHTQCAMASRRDDELQAAVAEAGGSVPDAYPWLAMGDPAETLAADVEAVRRSALIPPGVAVAGWRYDVSSGLINPEVG